MNFENILYNTLSQEANLFINKKILAQVGLNLAAFLSFLIDKGRYHKANNELTEDGFFFATNEDIYLFTGISRSMITKLKKEGEKQKFFYTKKLANSFKSATYYKLNFEKILSILSVDKSILELAYERTLPEDEETENKEYTEQTLLKFSCRELRLVCKKLQTPYSGKDNKAELIKKIIENQELSKWTNYTSTEQEEVSSSQVDAKSVHQWTDKLSIGGQEICLKKNQIQKKQNQKNQKDIDSLEIFENLFKDFNIVFTLKNKESVINLLKTMNQKEVINYLKDTYKSIKETSNVKNIGALFSSKIAKGQRQIVSNSLQKESKFMDSNLEKTKEKNLNEILEKFYNLPEEKRNTIEKEAVILCCKEKNISSDFLNGLKNRNTQIYLSSLKPYLNKILLK